MKRNLFNQYTSILSRSKPRYNVKKINFGDVFIRNYFRSTLFPKVLYDQFKKIYFDEFSPKIPTGHFNPSRLETLILKEKIVKFIKENCSKEDIKNFMQILHEFANQNYHNFNVLELIGFSKIDDQSLLQNLYFKVNSLSAILEIYDIKRSAHDNYPVIGFLNDNRRFIPAHCDKMHNDQIPQIVAIITLNSNSKAITFFTKNQIILEKLRLLNPKSLEILQEASISRYELNEKGFVVKTAPHKIINHRQDGSVFIKYNFSNDRYFISDPKNCKYTQAQLDQAITDFSNVSNKLTHSFKFICNERENIILFKNQQLVHGRTAVLNNETREMAYLPYDRDLRHEEQNKESKDCNDEKDEANLIARPESSIIKPLANKFTNKSKDVNEL